MLPCLLCFPISAPPLLLASFPLGFGRSLLLLPGVFTSSILLTVSLLDIRDGIVVILIVGGNMQEIAISVHLIMVKNRSTVLSVQFAHTDRPRSHNVEQSMR